jgi:hypothetical protein
VPEEPRFPKNQSKTKQTKKVTTKHLAWYLTVLLCGNQSINAKGVQNNKLSKATITQNCLFSLMI